MKEIEIELQPQLSFLDKLLNLFRIQAHVIKNGEAHHFKGIDSKGGAAKELGDYLTYVVKDEDAKMGSRLATFQITKIDGSKAILTQLEYNVVR